MPERTSHFTYRQVGSRVYATLNFQEGHTGSVLNCIHPECEEARNHHNTLSREDYEQATKEGRSAGDGQGTEATAGFYRTK